MNKLNNSLFVFCLAFLVLFYLYQMFATLTHLVVRGPTILDAIVMADSAATWLKAINGNTTDAQLKIRVVMFFHRKNFQIFEALANNETLPLDMRQKFFIEALQLNPVSIPILAEYVMFLNRINQDDMIIPIVNSSLPHFLTTHHITLPSERIEGVQFGSEDLEFFKPIQEADLYFAKAFYIIGKTVSDQLPMVTEEYLTYARSLAPWWADFHIELASYYLFTRQDPIAAEKALKNCFLYVDAANECEIIMKTGIPKFGTYYKQIKLIPIPSD